MGIRTHTQLKIYEHNGSTYTYETVHKWIKKLAGKADHCEGIDCKNKSTYYGWSNISKEYKKDRSDWQQLCRSCHAKFDMTDKSRESIRMRSIGSTTASKAIRQYSLTGEFIRTWPSLTAVRREIGILQSSISNHLSGKSKHAGGFIWKYSDTNKMS